MSNKNYIRINTDFTLKENVHRIRPTLTSHTKLTCISVLVLTENRKRLHNTKLLDNLIPYICDENSPRYNFV